LAWLLLLRARAPRATRPPVSNSHATHATHAREAGAPGAGIENENEAAASGELRVLLTGYI
jgi:hypothetical protein